MPYRVVALDDLMASVDDGRPWADRLAAALNHEEEMGWILLHVIPGRPGTRTLLKASVVGRAPERAALAS